MNVSRNVVHDILRCIERCDAHKKTLASRVAAGPQSAELETTQEVIKEIEIDLCNLLASMVTAPLSGRMFIPIPSEYTGASAMQDSLEAQMH